MTSDEYAHLMDFLASRFAKMDARFEALEVRMTRAEVLQEAMRDEIRLLAEGQVGLSARLDRIEVRLDKHDRRLDRIEARLEAHDRRFDRIDGQLDRMAGGVEGLQVQFDRFAVDFGTVQLDHAARLDDLERRRKR